MARNRDRIFAALIFLGAFIVFRVSPVRMITDSKFEMMFSQNLLWHHSFSLDGSAFPTLRSREPGQIHRDGTKPPYQLYPKGERFYYLYPNGNVILSMPYVALANLTGLSAVDAEGVYDHDAETRIQAGLAALLMAGFAVAVFLTSRFLLPWWWSALIADGIVFGTQVWSTASRAVWSHTWAIFILGWVIWMIVRAEVKKTPLRPIFFGTCVCWLYFARPTFSISIVGIALYVLVRQRRILVPFVLTGCAWLAAFVAFSEYHFRQWLPPYYSGQKFVSAGYGERLAGHFVSPSRGLFVYVPILLFVIYLFARYGPGPRRALFFLGTGVVAAHFLVVAGFRVWWAGHSYGPRLSTDLVPWFALLAILAVETRLRWRAENRSLDSAFRVLLEATPAALLLVLSMVLNGIGATQPGTFRWNAEPTNIDADHSRLWDWKHPQFRGRFPEKPGT